MTNPSNFKGAIIDFDGVVLDSLSVWTQIDVDFVSRHGFPGRHDIVEHLAQSTSLMDAAVYLHDTIGLPDSYEQICKEFEDLLIVEYRDTLQLIPGAYDALCKLKNAGTKMVLVTASPNGHAEPALLRTGTDHFFETIFSNADKTTPDVFHKALAVLGTTVEETIVIDDNKTNRATAAALGFTVRAQL